MSDRAKQLVAKMLEAAPPAPEPEDVDPEEEVNRLLGDLPEVFEPHEVINRIQTECAYCMDEPSDKRKFMRWIKANENLFPDVEKALSVVSANDSWCTDDEDDMMAFMEALGHRWSDDTCPRCSGTGEEPGAPADWEEGLALCDRCHGAGRLLTHCECDNTHQANNTVCRWCWARGRRHFNDPAV